MGQSLKTSQPSILIYMVNLFFKTIGKVSFGTITHKIMQTFLKMMSYSIFTQIIRHFSPIVVCSTRMNCFLKLI